MTQPVRASYIPYHPSSPLLATDAASSSFWTCFPIDAVPPPLSTRRHPRLAVGTTTKETAFAFLDAYFDAGGNFIDTANFAQHDDSEKWIGEWTETRDDRDQIVLATKYSGVWAASDPTMKQQAALIGNSTKSMKLSLEASLYKLRTSYVDILSVHCWSWTTTTEDVMDGVRVLIAQGTVLHIGASNTPAWIVAKGNQCVRDYGSLPFAIYQGE